MKFTLKHFDPLGRGGKAIGDGGSVAFCTGDRPDDVYAYRPKTILALNVAMATRRPLLISGEPGSGKSTLARSAAAVLGWRYYQQVITSRTQATDLLWTFDAIRRLNDAQDPRQMLLDMQQYVEPGVLWWAFDAKSATQRGTLSQIPVERQARNPALGVTTRTSNNSVVLLDEIDKADPDVPNDLLEPMDLKEFTVRETNDRILSVPDGEVLLLITTNGERAMPPAFLRRCVVLTLDPPDEDWLVAVADIRRGLSQHAMHVAVAANMMTLRARALREGTCAPSTSEYLDALAVCDDLDIDTQRPGWTDSEVWREVERTVLLKHSQRSGRFELESDDA